MTSSKISQLIVWITITWVILSSVVKRADGGPITFAACMLKTAPICGAASAFATATCAAVSWIPPAWCACMSGIMGLACAGAITVCTPVFFAPTP